MRKQVGGRHACMPSLWCTCLMGRPYGYAWSVAILAAWQKGPGTVCAWADALNDLNTHALMLCTFQVVSLWMRMTVKQRRMRRKMRG